MVHSVLLSLPALNTDGDLANTYSDSFRNVSAYLSNPKFTGILLLNPHITTEPPDRSHYRLEEPIIWYRVADILHILNEILFRDVFRLSVVEALYQH
jgi:hypothetical protein